MTEQQIREMCIEDVAAVALLETCCFSDPWSERSITAELENPLSLWLVAAQDGEITGYIGSQSVLDEADIMNIAVNPIHRRKGIAKNLLRELTHRLRANGVRAMVLEVRPTNESAIALYTQEGFAEIGRRKKYYVNPIEDALILRKEWTI